MVLWAGSYEGRLPRINEKYAATAIGKKGRVYVTPKYRKGTEDMAAAFSGRSAPITEKVNAYVEVGMWSRLDSDAPIKAIFDAMEKAGVVENDKLIADYVVIREWHKRDDPDWVRIVLVEWPETIAEFPEVGDE